MTQDLFQEVTGIKLQAEKEEYFTAKDYDVLSTQFLEMPAYNNITKEDTVWEFYFVPEEFTDNKQSDEEEYLVSVTTDEQQPCITLKKRCRLGELMNEKMARISKKQFQSLLLENYEWMKHSGELLLLELYNKFKLWKMRIGIFMECIRRQAYFAGERLLVTIDQYRAVPGNQEIFDKNPLYRQMKGHSHRITIRDFGSNYSGMECHDILNALSAV